MIKGDQIIKQKNKAIYKGSSRSADPRYYIQIWEYRGHEYEVEVPSNAWMCSSDYQSGGYNSQYNQHRRAQTQIDEMITNPAPEIEEPKPAAWTKEYEDKIWNMLGFDD